MKKATLSPWSFQGDPDPSKDLDDHDPDKHLGDPYPSQDLGDPESAAIKKLQT